MDTRQRSGRRVRTGAAGRIAAFAGAVLAAACTSTGMGSGELLRPGRHEQAVIFSWQSKDGGISGTMVAALPHASYAGPFFQITRQSQVQTLAPLWYGWGEGWGDWPYWNDSPMAEAYPATQFVTEYSGKVVANLVAGDGHRMRCRFHMMQPAAGMAGGGQGECQLSGGQVTGAMFPPQ